MDLNIPKLEEPLELPVDIRRKDYDDGIFNVVDFLEPFVKSSTSFTVDMSDPEFIHITAMA